MVAGAEIDAPCRTRSSCKYKGTCVLPCTTHGCTQPNSHTATHSHTHTHHEHVPAVSATMAFQICSCVYQRLRATRSHEMGTKVELCSRFSHQRIEASVLDVHLHQQAVHQLQRNHPTDRRLNKGHAPYARHRHFHTPTWQQKWGVQVWRSTGSHARR